MSKLALTIFVSLRDCARLMNCHVNYLLLMAIANRKLVAYDIRGEVRVLPRDLIRFADRQRVEAIQKAEELKRKWEGE